ncbi:hypothetical protein JCM21900_004057 [Sporobolomyces salmonicolor]
MARTTRNSIRIQARGSSAAADLPGPDSSGEPASSTAHIASASTSSARAPRRSSAAKGKRKADDQGGAAGSGISTGSSKGSKLLKRSSSSNPQPPPSTSDSPPPHVKPEEPLDRLTPLSAELVSLVLAHLTEPATTPAAVPRPDLKSLAQLCLVNKGLLPHARAALYRELQVETRVQAHAVHRALHGNNEVNKSVRAVTADVGTMAKTSSQWLGWFLFHSMHSLCGIVGSCRHLLTLTLYLPADSSAWTQSLCNSFNDLKYLHTLVKDLEPSADASGRGGAGKHEGMDVGWRPRRSMSMWAVSQFIQPLATLKSLHTLRLCGISSDSSTLPAPPAHSLKLAEVVLIEVNITNTDLLHLLGEAKHLKRFTLWRSSLLSKRGLTHVLKRCPHLVELRVGGSWFGAKEEDDTNYPLDQSLPSLPHLQLLHVSGSLISPAALLLPTLSLQHLLVHNSPSFSPSAVHAALVKMRHDPPSVARLTLPEMRPGGDSGKRFGPAGARNPAGAGAGAGSGGAAAGTGGTVEGWNETWRFTVKKTAEAKGVVVEDRWRRDGGPEPGAGADEDDSDSASE